MKRLQTFICTALVLMAFSVSAYAADVNLSWIAPTENTDGSPLTDLAGFSVYLGPTSEDRVKQVVTIGPDITTYTLQYDASWLMPGNNNVHAVMTAFDEEGNESAFSNEVVFVVVVDDTVAPKPPTLITITIEVGVDCPPGFVCAPVVISTP